MPAAKITLDEVLRVARLARLSPSPEDALALQSDLDAILGYFALLDEVDTSKVEPTAHAVTMQSALREDVVHVIIDRDEALAAAPASHDGGFAVPKVLEVET